MGVGEDQLWNVLGNKGGWRGLSSLVCGNDNCHLDVPCPKPGVTPGGSTAKEAGAGVRPTKPEELICQVGEHAAEPVETSLPLHTRDSTVSPIRLCVQVHPVYVAGGGTLKFLV